MWTMNTHKGRYLGVEGMSVACSVTFVISLWSVDEEKNMRTYLLEPLHILTATRTGDTMSDLRDTSSKSVLKRLEVQKSPGQKRQQLLADLEKLAYDADFYHWDNKHTVEAFFKKLVVTLQKGL